MKIIKVKTIKIKIYKKEYFNIFMIDLIRKKENFGNCLRQNFLKFIV